jgi:GrpB-like predicted nucleotidyltransferase (UPF0157 family)
MMRKDNHFGHWAPPVTERSKPKLRPEEEMVAYTIGELKPLAAPILFGDYDPAWPAWYEREAARVRAILGNRVKLLEHAGSTAVIDLPAKPTIDMVLAVPDSSDEASYVPDMERARYVLRIREPHWFEHRVFKGPDTDINLHVFSAGCPEIDQMLVFRDWLRDHPDDRDLYAATKRALAKQPWKFVQHYADAKTAVIRAILARARAASEGAA